MPEPAPTRRDALTGLAPAPATQCPRCGCATTALANGRGRLDICETCGTIDFATPEGVELFRMRQEMEATGWAASGWEKEGARRPVGPPRERRALE